MSDTFCILPWMHVATSSSGSLRVCCNSAHGLNTPKNEAGKPYRVDRPGDIERYFASNDMRKMRRQMLSGEEPEACSRCFKEERSGVRSARQVYNAMYGHLQPMGEEPLSPTYLDLRFGNLCNLRCRMCNAYSSNLMVDEWNTIYPEDPLPESEVKRLRSMDWSEREETWAEIERHLDTVDLIYLTGGEPTISKGNDRLLDLLIESGRAQNVSLKYNTNATNVPERLIERWQHFRGIHLNLSVDAVGPLARYIRYPSNWKAIDRNLKRLDAVADGRPNWHLTMHVTVQVYNVTRLQELLDYCLDFRTIGRFPYLNILDHPEHFNIQVLPQSFKDEITEGLMSWYTNHRSNLHGEAADLVEKLPQMLSYMNAMDRSDILPVFREKTRAFDQSRSESCLDVLPEFKPLF